MKERKDRWARVRLTLLAITIMCCGIASGAGAATQAQIDAAIQQGLAWQASQQNLDGSFGSPWWDYYVADTATAVLAFENEGHFPGGGSIYSGNVEQGLDYIFSFAQPIDIGPQWNGNPDTNGNGKGIYFSQYSYMYETGLVMQALVASNTPDRVVTVGPCAGMTYRQVLQDVVDFVAWAQIDGGPGRGGWRYDLHDNAEGWADNSVSQWPVLGLVAAEQWGVVAPAFVRSELEYWVTYIQNDDGGSGYDAKNDVWWNSNVSRTGGLLVEFYYLGDTKDTPRVKKALNFINDHWNEAPFDWNGNRGNPYAMFSVFKGLELLRVVTVPNAPANLETPAGDWWGDYSDYLVYSQALDGYWSGYAYWGQYLATPWYIVILQATVFPVSVDVIVPGAACDLTGYEVSIQYSIERFAATGTLKVYRDGALYDTVTITDFKGTATKTYNVAPETVGDHVWKAVLAVSGGGISTSAEDTAGGKVYETPQVSGIPDQVAPFTAFDLDNFQTCDCASVDWSVSGVPAGWTVTIDAEHVVMVIAPPGATEPAALTFKAIFHWPGIDCEGSDTAIFSPNRPPLAHPGKMYPGEEYEVPEGGTVLLDGSLSSDPDGDTLVSYAWDLDGNGTFETPGVTATLSAVGKDGPSELYVHLQVCDEHGACSIGTAEVAIENVAPVITAISADPYIVPVGAPVLVAALFSDGGQPDTHTAVCTFNGDPPVSATVIEAMGAGSATASHVYTVPGIYTATMSVTDDDGGIDSAATTIIVYDPSAGFITGGGWINSPAGAYKADPALAGKANFGFVSKYQKGAAKPTGQTEFQFQTGNLNFHSTSYDWLVVTNGGTTAQYKGTGTVNGAGAYKFIIWATDGTSDTFRIKIWSEEAGVETIMYDNGFSQPIGSGSIVIHVK